MDLQDTFRRATDLLVLTRVALYRYSPPPTLFSHALYESRISSLIGFIGPIVL